MATTTFESLSNVMEGRAYAPMMTDRFPLLKPFYLEAENMQGIFQMTQATAEHWEFPLVALALYVLLITVGPRVMENHKPFDLRGPLIAWNLLLSVFSFIGMLRTVPHLIYNLNHMPFEDTICNVSSTDWGTGSTGLWVMLFIYSKIPELIDTVFIVLRKKKLIFLHWYHHISVLLYCWHAYATESATGLYFVAMNYTVHAVMYGYYCLMALKMVPRWFPAWTITIGQIAQMVIGTVVCLSSWYYVVFTDKPCNNTVGNLIAATIMYGSYLYLFVDFAVRRFVFRKPRAPKKDKTL